MFIRYCTCEIFNFVKLHERFMKKALLIAALVFLGVKGQSQSLEVTPTDLIVYGHPMSTSDMVAHAGIRNNSSNAIDVKVRRRYNANHLTDSNAICWGVCFSTKIDTSLTTISLQPGERNENDFSGHVYPNRDGQVFTGDITYIFYDANNPSDSASMTISFELTNSFSVPELKKGWNVYPNPATDHFYVAPLNSEWMQGKLVLTDMLGKVVKTKPLSSSEGRVRISTSDLRNGVYIYALYDGNTLIEKRKLVVSRK